MIRPAPIPKTSEMMVLIAALAAAIAASCASSPPQKLPPPVPPPQPVAKADPCEEFIAQQKKLEDSLSATNVENRALETQVTGLKLQLVERDTRIGDLDARGRALEAKLDEAIQEVVRAKSKLRSLESRAEAASNMAEAEIALKAIEAQGKGAEEGHDVSQAQQLLKRSAEEFKNENYGGALYLANQAKSLLRTGEVRPATRDRLTPVAGESPFDAPMPLQLTRDGNLREGPGLEFRVITLLPKGSKVSGLSRKDQWVRVRGETGATGWVFQTLLGPR
jgi:hypothetical protein